ncbi:MAG TPA: hypothetical protein VM901_04720 [Bdellovibrionota bacterium]|jgi:hypothetical protein|nr:hypothetical protein [Bdellovibrionota bacterium]
MGLWLSLTILLNALSAVLIVVVFALVKRQSALRQDIQRLQKEWIQWRAMGMPMAPVAMSSGISEVPEMAEADEPRHYVSEHQIQEPAIDFNQAVRPRATFSDDWAQPMNLETPAAAVTGGIREKPAKSLKSETLGEPVDRFGKARELLRQGHGMKEVAIVTGLSYSELALLSKMEAT